MHRYFSSVAVLVPLVAAALASTAAGAWLNPADPTVVTITDLADNQFSFYASPSQQTEWLDKHGAETSSRLKGAEDISGFKFDLAAYKGKTVQDAELHLARANTDQVFAMVAATINADWTETSACWRYRTGTTDWTFPAGDFSTASFGSYGSLTCFAYAADNTFKTYTNAGYTWIAMKLDPALVQALILDQPGGLAVTDPRGHLYTNPAVYTREAGIASQPRLYIQFASATDTTPPGAVANLAASAGPENGQATLTFAAPADPQAPTAFGYTVRYATSGTFASATNVERWRIPRPATPGMIQNVLIEGLTPNTSYTFYVQAYDAAGNGDTTIPSTTFKVPAALPTATLATGPIATPNPAGKTVPTVTGVLRYWAASEVAKVNPVTGNRYEDGYTGSGADNYKKASAVWDAATSTISLIGCRNEVLGAQLILERIPASLTGVTVTASDLAGPNGTTIPANPNIELFQQHYVNSSGTYYADAAIPLKAPFPTTFSIPDANHNPSGKNQSVWLDFYLPTAASPGDYTGTITVTTTQMATPLTVNVKVHVSTIAVPDYPTFIVDLNGYGAPWDFGTGNNIDLTCLRYFQTAHKHRAMCNILGYGWNGSVRSDRAPTLTGAGPTLHAAAWTSFDSRFGRFFDGTAFLPTTPNSPYTGPGMNTPVTHWYTPFHEMWPVSLIDTTYGFDAAGKGGAYWNSLVDTNAASFFASAPDIYPAFPDGYKQGIRNVIADWFAHAQANGWTRTAFECYLNNKYYYSGSYSLWELEECTTGDDFRAVGFFHQLFRDGQAAAGTPNVKWHFRLDISDRWGQNWGQLNNRINWFCMGSGAAGWHWPNKEYRKYALLPSRQENWIWYGLGEMIAASGMGNAQAFLQKWAQGFDGGLPYWDNYQMTDGSNNVWTYAHSGGLVTLYSGQSVPGFGQYEGAIASTRLKMLRQVEQVIELCNLWAATPGMNRQRVRDAVFARYGTKGASDFSFSQLDELKLYQLHADLIAQMDTTSPSSGGLQVTPTTGLTSSGPVGGPFSPTSVTCTLTNTSTAPLNWTASKGQAWLTLSKTGGALAAGATDTVIVSLGATAAALTAGTYTDTISFTNTTNHVGDTTRPASLTVQASAAGLQVTPSSDFTSSGPQGGPFAPPTATYTLTNTGTAPLNWTASKGQPWVTLSKASGTLAAGATDTVVASINATANGLASGPYADSITFTNATNGVGTTTRQVSLGVGQPAPTPGVLDVSPGSRFDSAGPQGGPFLPVNFTYTLTNTGDSALDWTVAAGQPWLSLQKTSGTLAGHATDTVTVSIMASAAAMLGLGTYTDTVTFTNTTNGNGSTSRAASLLVRTSAPGTLVVSPMTNFSSTGIKGGPFNPASVTYTLTNTGDSPIDWNVSANAAWLSFSKTSGTLAARASDTVVVSLSAAAKALDLGAYTNTITFTNATNNQGNTTRTASLTVRKPVPGTLTVSPAIGFSGTGAPGGPFTSNSITYTLSNIGDTTFDWSADKAAPWLHLSKTSGTITPGGTDAMMVSLDSAAAAMLSPATYTDTITFTNVTNNQGNTTRNATLLVTPLSPGALSVTPAGGLSAAGPLGGPFGAAQILYTLANTGHTPIDWTAATGQTWLVLSKSSGTLNPGDTDAVTVSAGPDADLLGAGMQTDTVTFTNVSNDSGTTTRTMNLDVGATPGRLLVSPAVNLDSSGMRGGPFSPASITYTLTNSGTLPVAWTAAATQSWVTVSRKSGTLTAGSSTTVTVSIGPGAAQLTGRNHADAVTFTNATSGDGTTARTVSLTARLPGDIDDDGVVGILDLLLLARAYDTAQGDALYDPSCDLTLDGRVDLSDLLILVVNFGAND